MAINEGWYARVFKDKILRELEKFLLEFRSDFTFMGRQKRI